MKILITGASGSGTTTLGKVIASRLEWAFIEADDYYLFFLFLESWLTIMNSFNNK